MHRLSSNVLSPLRYSWVLRALLMVFLAYFLLDLSESEQWSWERMHWNLDVNLGLALSLVLLNWGLEVARWQRLMGRVRRVGPMEAAKGVLSGACLSLFTPDRIGTVFGRVIPLESDVKWRAGAASIYGSLVQFLVTATLGIPGLFLVYRNDWVGLSRIEGLTVMFLAVGLILVWFIFWQPIYLFRPWLRAIISFRLYRAMSVWKDYEASERHRLVWLTLARNLTFMVQFWLLIRCFASFQVGWTEFSLIGSTYLMSMLTPSLFLGKLMVRESVSILLFSLYLEDVTPVVMASLMLWAMNVLLPGLLGAGVLLTYRFNR